MTTENKLALARAILIDALIVAGGQGAHAPHCKGAEFARHNQNCPPNHPVWKSAPKCDCWLGAAADFLNNR
jgi:hypothetical protein